MKDRLDSVQKEFDQLVGTRRRALERPLQQLEELRVRRNLPVDGELFEPTPTSTTSASSVRDGGHACASVAASADGADRMRAP